MLLKAQLSVIFHIVILQQEIFPLYAISLLHIKEVFMHKAFFKCILSFFTLIGGILLTLSPLLGIYKSSSIIMTYLLLGTLLIVISLVSYNIHAHHLKIIRSLKNKDVPVFAHWFCNPTHSSILKRSLLENRHTHLSLIFLLGLLSLLLSSGIALTLPANGLHFSLIVSTCVITLCTLSYLLVFFYYKNKLYTNVETIIGDEAIYFSNTLYLLHYSAYFLSDVVFMDTLEPYLQFSYGIPGTPYTPMHLVTIPVPLSQVEVARHICAHYLKLINT